MARQLSWTAKDKDDEGTSHAKTQRHVGKILAKGKRFPTVWSGNMEQREGLARTSPMSLDKMEARSA